MSNILKIEWLLRIGLAGTFIGHGAFALGGKESWIGWIMDATGWDMSLAAQALFLIGILDIVVGLILLVKPVRVVILWAVVWTSWTTIMRILPFIGDPIWEFLEKMITPAAALALLFVRGIPTNFKEWFK